MGVSVESATRDIRETHTGGRTEREKKGVCVPSPTSREANRAPRRLDDYAISAATATMPHALVATPAATSVAANTLDWSREAAGEPPPSSAARGAFLSEPNRHSTHPGTMNATVAPHVAPTRSSTSESRRSSTAHIAMDACAAKSAAARTSGGALLRSRARTSPRVPSPPPRRRPPASLAARGSPSDARRRARRTSRARRRRARRRRPSRRR